MPSIAPTRLPALAVAWPLGLAAVLAAFPFGSPAIAAMAPRQDSAAGTAAASGRLKLLNEVLHQVQIAKPEAAAQAATALMDTGITPAELADLVDSNDLGTRFDRVMTRGRGLEGFAAAAAQLEQMLRQGRLDLARRPDRIDEAIGLLGGTLRQQMFAAERLAAADEFAMPGLLKMLVTGDSAQQIAASKQIAAMGRFAVQPLCAALPKLDPTAQRSVADLLGEIGYPEARPYLLALASAEGTTGDVREAAMRALGKVGGTGETASAAFTALAKRFFDGEDALIMHPGDERANVWAYDPFGGLVATPVPTPIFFDVMGMRAAAAALALDPADAGALALYAASDLSRGNHLPDGATDPVFGDNRYSAEFFATAAGPTLGEAVLGLAIDRRDTTLVLDAIRALAGTGGRDVTTRAGWAPLVECQQYPDRRAQVAAAIAIGLAIDGRDTTLVLDAIPAFAGTGGRDVTTRAGRAPLVECLQYPDRRVQVEAALAIVASDPQQSFSGDFRVVPILASAVRDSGSKFATVVAENAEDRNAMSAALAALGYTPMTGGASFAECEAEIGRESGLDLLVVQGSPDFVASNLGAVRLSRLASAVPVLAVTDVAGAPAATRVAEADGGTVVWIAGSGSETLGNAVDAVMLAQSGGEIGPEEGLEYAIRGLDALKTIGLRGRGIFKVLDAEPALLSALAGRTGGLRLLVADVLAMMPTAESQQTLVAIALAGGPDEEETVELLARAAASARSHGRLATEEQVAELRELVGTSSGSLADAAGRLYGALDLPSGEVVKLIGTKKVW
jgi:HEAT repeat protein